MPRLTLAKWSPRAAPKRFSTWFGRSSFAVANRTTNASSLRTGAFEFPAPPPMLAVPDEVFVLGELEPTPFPGAVPPIPYIIERTEHELGLK